MSLCGNLLRADCRHAFLAWLRNLAVLFKLPVVALLLFAATGGALLGAGAWPGLGDWAVLALSGGLVSAGASAINQYLERRSDAQMGRTRRRPLATGALARPAWVPVVGGLMVLGPILAVWPGNPALALFLFLGAFVYLLVYTLWLKPRTALNIVIGGAAGSCTVLSGGAAVGNWADPGVLVLALLVLAWTPIHFWSLALACRDDYARVGVPMLPVHATPRRAAFWSWLHGLAAVALGLGLGRHPSLGAVYLVSASGAGLALLAAGWRLLRRPTAGWAWRVFHISNVYLALLLASVCLDIIIW